VLLRSSVFRVSNLPSLKTDYHLVLMTEIFISNCSIVIICIQLNTSSPNP